jgi:hypothetical protein
MADWLCLSRLRRHSRDHGALLLDLVTQTFVSSRSGCFVIAFSIQSGLRLLQSTSICAGIGGLDDAIAGFNVLVVSPDASRAVCVHIRRDAARPPWTARRPCGAMTSMLNEQHDEQPNDGDRGTDTVLEVWIPN